VIADAIEPFVDAEEYLKASWRLGYQDGFAEIDPVVGEQTLLAMTAESWDHQTRLEVASMKEDRLKALQESAEDDLIPGSGREPTSRGHWIMITIYVLLTLLALITDALLAGTTVGQVIGGKQFNDLVRRLQLWTSVSLALNICTAGFSLKLLYESIRLFRPQRRHWRSWVPLPAVVLCLVLSFVSIVWAARLRSAVSQVSRDPELDQSQSISDSIDTVDTSAKSKDEDAKIAEVAKSSGNTFYWLTLALPCLTGACAIVVAHSREASRRHNAAVRTLKDLTESIPAAVEQRSKLEKQFGQGNGGTGDGFDGVRKMMRPEMRCISMYRHGYSVGGSELAKSLGKEPAFQRALRRLKEGRI